MICPVDKSAMIVVEHKRIELDYCTSCHGVWFDSGELELLLENMGVAGHREFMSSVFASPEAASAENKHRCPICKQKMKKTTVGQQPALLIDACPQGHGLWFDGGEVGGLLKKMGGKPSSTQEGQVTGFLTEVLKASM